VGEPKGKGGREGGIGEEGGVVHVRMLVAAAAIIGEAVGRGFFQ